MILGAVEIMERKNTVLEECEDDDNDDMAQPPCNP